MDRQRLLFESALAGTCLGILSFTTKEFFQFLFPTIYHAIHDLRPVDVPLIGTSILTLLLSTIISFLLNFVFPKAYGLRRAIKKRGNEMELMLRDAMVKQRMVAITLLTNKVYVGWVNELQIPSNSGYIRIIPTFSGFRNDAHKFEFNNHYLSMLN